MAEIEADEASVDQQDSVDSSRPIPRMRLSQMSHSGVITLGGDILENCKDELQFPRSISTFDKMAQDQDIQPALDMVEMSLARVPWSVEIPEGFEDDLKEDKEFLEQVLFEDMEHTFEEFISRVVSMNRYGFAPIEKVFRKRTFAQGSKYNDGRVGLRALPLIDQHTVAGWQWDESQGRRLTHVVQYKNKSTGIDQDPTQLPLSAEGKNYTLIPRNKFILFKNKVKGDSPQSQSALVGVWKAWKIKTSLEEYLAMGVAKDLQGLPVLRIPAEVMADDADEVKKKEYEFWKGVVRNMHLNQQAGLIIPSLTDEKGNPYYDLETVNTSGQKAYDVLSIIEFYRKSIVTALMASQLVLGQDGSGSYALSESLSGVSSLTVESKLKEIEAQINHDLIPQLFALNGIHKRVLPRVKFGDLSTPDLDVLSKFIQRVGSMGLISRTPAMANWIAGQLNAPKPFADLTISPEEAANSLTGNTSSSGEGMASGSGGLNGTSNSVAGGDNSAGNSENASSQHYTILAETDEFVRVSFGGRVTEFMREDWEAMKKENT